MRAALQTDEAGRQAALDQLAILDTPAEPEFEKITGLVRTVFDVPIAAVSLVDRDRLWFKSLQGLDVTEAPRDIAFCDHTIRTSTCFRVEDASVHPLFHDNPLIVGPPHLRSYIGAPLITSDGFALGSLCAMDVRPRVFSDAQAAMLVSFADLVLNQLELRRMATVDMLTGLATRRAFASAMDSAMAECDRSGVALSLLCLDLDRFKAINDTHGHGTGDAVLAAVGDILQRQLPAMAFAGRTGGEELAVLLIDADVTAAARVAEDLRATIAAHVLPDAPAVPFTASIGVAQRQPGMTAAAWMAAADAALYQAKHGGRNRVVCADPDRPAAKAG